MFRLFWQYGLYWNYSKLKKTVVNISSSVAPQYCKFMIVGNTNLKDLRVLVYTVHSSSGPRVGGDDYYRISVLWALAVVLHNSPLYCMCHLELKEWMKRPAESWTELSRVFTVCLWLEDNNCSLLIPNLISSDTGLYGFSVNKIWF